MAHLFRVTLSSADWRNTSNMPGIVNDALFYKVAIVTVLFGILPVSFPALVLSLSFAGWGEFAEPIYAGLYAANVAIAHPKLYMVSPNFRPNGMWRRAVKKGGRWVPNYWLESADLLEYWRRMFECSRELRRFRIRS